MRQSKGLLPAAGKADSGTKWSGVVFAAGVGENAPTRFKDSKYASAAIPFSSSTGFGNTYAPLDDFTNSEAYGISVHPNQTDVAFAWKSDRTALIPLTAKKFSPAIGWYGPRFTYSYTEGSNEWQTATDCAFSPLTGNYIGVTGVDKFYCQILPYSPTTGFGAKFPNPSYNIIRGMNRITFSPDETVVALAPKVASRDSICIAYKWSAAGWGTKYSSPSSPIITDGAMQSTGVTFNPTGDAIAVSNYQSPGIFVYPWSNQTGFGAKYSDPVSAPGQNFNGVAWNSDGTEIAVCGQSVPGAVPVNVYPWSPTGGFGTKYAEVVGFGPTGSGPRNVVWSPNDSDIFVAIRTQGGGSSGLMGYEWKKGVGFGKQQPSAWSSYGQLNDVAIGPSF